VNKRTRIASRQSTLFTLLNTSQ